MNPKTSLENLPLLLLRKIFNHLSPKDLLRLRNVSRSWRLKFDFQVKSLCFIDDKICDLQKIGIHQFINALTFSSFGLFVGSFSQSILSNLKNLRLHKVDLYKVAIPMLARILNLFGTLEQLHISRVEFWTEDFEQNSEPNVDFELNLPMLNSIEMNEVQGMKKTILKAPKLKKVNLVDCLDMRLEFVHAESVEQLAISGCEQIEMKQFKSLKSLYIKYCECLDSKLLSSLERLKEIHLAYDRDILKIETQMRQYGRLDLKIFLWICSDFINDQTMACWPENVSRLADEMPFCSLRYLAIKPHLLIEPESTLFTCMV